MTRAVLVALLLALAPAAASAEVVRIAVLIGNNRGQDDEIDLRYAESDAARFRDVLIDLGGFRHENVVLMQGADAVTVRRAIVSLNERVRSLSGTAQVVLLVYYSGHADADELHLGPTRFSTRELEQLVGGSAAAVRLLVVDSCRSGALTRSKGGRPGPSFAIQLDERLAAHGAIYLTSSAANEDAQESDRLKSSFFTHYLLSGMLGAADTNGDAEMDLGEVYRYAYENTLRASSRTLAGTQHPSFRYAMAGHDNLVLTRLQVPGSRRGLILFPEGRSYLLFQGGPDGPVVAEIGRWDRQRVISVREGRYFVRGRGTDHLLEGMLVVAAGEDKIVLDRGLDRIAYDRLVRKGGDVLDQVHGPVIAARVRSALDNGEGSSLGVVAGWAIEYPRITLGFRATYQHDGYVRGATVNRVDVDLEELGGEARIGHVWDSPVVAIEPFVALGGGVFWQRFESERVQPDRVTGMAHLDVGVTVRGGVANGAYLFLESAVQTYWFRQVGEQGETAPSTAVGLSAGVGFWL